MNLERQAGRRCTWCGKSGHRPTYHREVKAKLKAEADTATALQGLPKTLAEMHAKLDAIMARLEITTEVNAPAEIRERV